MRLKIKPEKILAVEITEWDDSKRESIIEYIAIRYSAEPFYIGICEYVKYEYYSEWYKNGGNKK